MSLYRAEKGEMKCRIPEEKKAYYETLGYTLTELDADAAEEELDTDEEEAVEEAEEEAESEEQDADEEAEEADDAE